MKQKALTRRQVATIASGIEGRLQDALVLLAAVALQYGRNGKLVVGGSYVDDVARLSEERSVAVRALTNGDMRVDFAAPALPELEVTVIEEAPCSST